MKLNKMLLMAAVAVGLVACNNKEEMPEPGKPGQGNAYAGLYITAQPETRALEQENYEGREEESKLTKLNLLSSVENKEWEFASALADGKFAETGSGTKTYTVNPWKTSAGKQLMALIFNQNDATTVSIGQAKSHVFGTADVKKDISDLSTENAFVMTSETAENNIIEGITENQATEGTDHTQNVFSFTAERVVAQGMVAKEGALKAETNNGQGKVDLATITYAAVNGATKTYLYRDKAGERTMNTTSLLYTGYKSAIDNYAKDDYETARDAAAAGEYLIRLGNISTTSNDELGGYKAIPVADNADAAKGKRGIYFLENSAEKGKSAFDKKENKDYGFYRMAYAKVYATFIPKEVLKWDGSTKKLVKEARTTAEDFYKGEGDGLLYADRESAKHSLSHSDQKAYKYTNGRCAYRALWNLQVKKEGDEKLVKNADTRRNNVYLITIEAFQGLGMPWDSSDPNDPNLPKSDDPEEPTTPPDNPDIEKQDTYMRVKAEVLPWNLVSRKVTLD